MPTRHTKVGNCILICRVSEESPKSFPKLSKNDGSAESRTSIPGPRVEQSLQTLTRPTNNNVGYKFSLSRLLEEKNRLVEQQSISNEADIMFASHGHKPITNEGELVDQIAGDDSNQVKKSLKDIQRRPKALFEALGHNSIPFSCPTKVYDKPWEFVNAVSHDCIISIHLIGISLLRSVDMPADFFTWLLLKQIETWDLWAANSCLSVLKSAIDRKSYARSIFEVFPELSRSWGWGINELDFGTKIHASSTTTSSMSIPEDLIIFYMQVFCYNIQKHGLHDQTNTALQIILLAMTLRLDHRLSIQAQQTLDITIEDIFREAFRNTSMVSNKSTLKRR